MALKRRSNRVASLPAKIQGFFATLRMTSNDEGKNNDNGTSRSLRDDNKKGNGNSGWFATIKEPIEITGRKW